MTQSAMDSAALIEAAEKLAPLLRAKAREAELARRPLDEVIDAVRESGLFSLMVPRCYGGHEADLDALLNEVNAQVEEFERLGFLTVVKDPWLIENGFLTPTMKMKRTTLEDTYGPKTEEWYGVKKRVVWEA